LSDERNSMRDILQIMLINAEP